MFDEVNEIMEAMINDDRFFKNVSTIMRKLYDALVAEGLTKDQATQIIANFKVGAS